MDNNITYLANKYNLEIVDNNTLQGELFITDNDSYCIEISNISRFPNSFPLVRELGGRIPQKADRHIYPKEGYCCFTTPIKEKVLLNRHIKTLNDFIAEIVIKFFLNNSFYEINGKYATGEYSHGTMGIIESYQEITKIKDINSLIVFLTMIIDGNKSDRNERCLCNSGIKWKNCHLRIFEELNLIEKSIIKNDLDLIKKG